MSFTASAQEVCDNGFAGSFPCNEINLQSFVNRGDLGGGSMNDVWGWTDPQTGREYVLAGRSSGVSFVDISEPLNPVVVGILPTATNASSWRDVKVYADHAYIVADNAGNHGVQVFNLGRLRDVVNPPFFFEPDAHYTGVASAHNIAINEDSGFAFVVGSQECAGGLHMLDLGEPENPVFAGCFSADGYTHDVQCVNYMGPDPDYAGREICFAANTDTITIVDVTDKTNPVQIFRAGYPGAGYIHQGWLTSDHTTFVQNDELDELNNGHNTRTYFWDVSDLDSPEIIHTYDAETTSLDHNLYIRGHFVFQSNYSSGLRILDASDPLAPREIAFFDTYPANDNRAFIGSWSNYPYFGSGNIAVTSMGEGLFILRPTIPLLPASLVAFSASLIDDSSVSISWRTQGELGVEAYAVQLQTPGGVFQSTSTIDGAGTTSTEQLYDALIEGVEPGPRVFRLMITTIAGEIFFSEPVAIFVPVAGTHELFAPYPNPAREASRVSLIVRDEQTVAIIVYDAAGREQIVVHEGVVEADTRHLYTIDTSRLAAGTYFIRVLGRDFDESVPVAVVH